MLHKVKRNSYGLYEGKIDYSTTKRCIDGYINATSVSTLEPSKVGGKDGNTPSSSRIFSSGSRRQLNSASMAGVGPDESFPIQQTHNANIIFGQMRQRSYRCITEI